MRTKRRPTDELLALGVFGRRSRLAERVEMLLTRGRDFSPRVSKALMTVGTAGLVASLIIEALAPKWIAFAEQPRFEVASIKPSDPENHRWSSALSPGGRFSATNMHVQDLVERAYGVKPFQIAGGPSWIVADRFDISAKATGAIDEEQLRAMLQTLLADRFKLAIRRETREKPIYRLVAEKTGAKVREVNDEIPAEPPASVFASHVSAHRASMQWLSDFLSSELEAPVVDRTGLRGRYAWELAWDPSDSEGPMLMTVVQEQLGLTLEPTKGPVEILVIDHVEKPDAN